MSFLIIGEHGFLSEEDVDRAKEIMEEKARAAFSGIFPLEEECKFSFRCDNQGSHFRSPFNMQAVRHSFYYGARGTLTRMPDNQSPLLYFLKVPEGFVDDLMKTYSDTIEINQPSITYFTENIADFPRDSCVAVLDCRHGNRKELYINSAFEDDEVTEKVNQEINYFFSAVEGGMEITRHVLS